MEMSALISKLLHINDPVLLSEVERIASLRCLEKGACAGRIGELQTQIHVLVSGIIRCFFYDATNQEYTDCFLVEPGAPVMMSSADQSRVIASQAVVPTVLLEIQHHPFLELMHRYPELLWVYNRMLHRVLTFQWQIKSARYAYNALQRYVWFRKNWPEVESAANSRHIASFLGMTPETLSRVRRTARDSDEIMEIISDPNAEWDATLIEVCLSVERR